MRPSRFLVGPRKGRTEKIMSNWKALCLACALWATTAIVSPAQTFTTLFSFSKTDGASPMAPLIQATNGNLYGSATVGGSGDGGPCFGGLGCGEAFEISPTGKLTTLYNFCAESSCDDGAYPVAGLAQGANGNFYGTTNFGGGGISCGIGCGTVFELTPTGKLTTFYAFCAQQFCPDGANPAGGLVQATNQNFYGTTSLWGSGGSGTFFELTPAGTLTTLYNFCTATFCDDGSDPTGTLVQASNGSLYGITIAGGHFLGGVVYKITTTGKLSTVYAFGFKSHYGDGLNPSGSLIRPPTATSTELPPGAEPTPIAGTRSRVAEQSSKSPQRAS